MLAMITIVANEETPKLDGRRSAQVFSISTQETNQFETIVELFDNRGARKADPHCRSFDFGVSSALSTLLKNAPTAHADLNFALKDLAVAISTFLNGREFSLNNGIQGFFSIGSRHFEVKNL